MFFQQVKGCPDLIPRCGEFKLTKWPYFTSNLVACALAMMLGIAARATKPPSE